MRIWASKLKYSIKRITRKIPTIIWDTLAIAGALLMVAEGASEIFSYEGIFQFYEQYFVLIILAIVIGSIIKNWDYLSFEAIVEVHQMLRLH